MSKITYAALAGLVAAIAAGACADPLPAGAPPVARAGPPSSVFDDMRHRYAGAQSTPPSADQFAAAYPPRARDSKTEGTVTLACTPTLSGRLSSCEIVDEWPKGYGFGAATVKAYLKYYSVQPDTVQGGIQPGDFEIFTQHWTVNP